MENEFYFDSMSIESSQTGIRLKFLLGPYGPRDAREKSVDVAMSYCSWECAKAMTFAMARLIRQVEAREGVVHPLPISYLNHNNVAPEDWNAFWGVAFGSEDSDLP